MRSLLTLTGAEFPTFTASTLAYVPVGGNIETFALIASLVGVLCAVGSILRVRRALFLSGVTGTGALFLALGLWRERAGHVGAGTIARSRAFLEIDLDGHGAAPIGAGMMAGIMAAGLLAGVALFCWIRRRRRVAKTESSPRHEQIWLGILAVTLAATTWFLRFDDLTRLHEAAAAGGSNTVVRLLDDHPELATELHFGRSAIWRAAQVGDVETIRALLEAGAGPLSGPSVPSRDGSRVPFMQAASRGHVDAARLLLRAEGVAAQQQASPNSPHEMNYLHWAASAGQLEILRMLLDEGLDSNALALESQARETALFCARNPSITQELIQRGTDPKLGQPLMGRYHRDAESVRLLLEAGADPNCLGQEGRTPLGFASREAAQLLLDAGASTELGSPLHWAVRSHNTGTVGLLLDAGVDPSSLDGDGRTAHSYSDLKVITEMLEQHTD